MHQRNEQEPSGKLTVLQVERLAALLDPFFVLLLHPPAKLSLLISSLSLLLPAFRASQCPFDALLLFSDGNSL